MFKVVIIGCGKIAETHAEVINSMPDSKLEAAFDREELMARQLAERYGAKYFYGDLNAMLQEAKPDIVHITTPPQSHYEIGKTCLEHGCHVLIEKPFTLNSIQTEEIIALARLKNLKLTLGTDEQFSIIAIEMRNLIDQGWLGGRPVHMDVYYCYDFGDERFAKAFIKNKTHWLWKLPGQLIQNIIPHAVMKICEFLDLEGIEVIASGFTSDFLKNLGESELKDELRALIIDKRGTTAYLTFSTQMRPLLRQFRIFGPQNGLLIDQDYHALIKLSGKGYLSYADKFIPLNDLAHQYRKNMFRNARLFLKRKFQMKRGLYNLVNLFYKSIENNEPPPIPYNQITSCSRIVDSIISQIYNRR